ncbi:MAG: hypothetical protein ACQPRH_04165 [Solitalea-like symbiont of Tyrophagus putrescentiae]
MKENEYDKALEEMLKAMRINLNGKDSRVLTKDNDIYQQPTMRPYNFERPEENGLMYLTFIVKDDVTKEDLDIGNTDMHLNPLYKNVEKDVNVDISTSGVNPRLQERGYIIKKLMPPDDGGKDRIKCVSINPEYPPFEVGFENIYAIYRILLCMSRK